VDRLAKEDFIKLHRSALVRHDFIERMYREGGHWVAILNDGSRERVAKSHVSETLERLRVDSATPEVNPSNRLEFVEAGRID
jgi:DNA-binding LytR/AlgR family response regulator